jgi:hypothetical protein
MLQIRGNYLWIARDGHETTDRRRPNPSDPVYEEVPLGAADGPLKHIDF